jgi:hypothetical protein
MSKRRPTFTDPKTGERIKSTALARWVARLVSVPFCGWLGWSIGNDMGSRELAWCCMLLFALAVGWQTNSLTQPIHDRIARIQHFRRQRISRRKQWEEEWAGVPDGAISRARATDAPDPTQVSLSRSEPLGEDVLPRLEAGVDAAEQAEEQTSRGDGI